MNDDNIVAEQNPAQALWEILVERLERLIGHDLAKVAADDLLLIFEGVWVHKDVEWPEVDSPETGLPESAVFTRSLNMGVKLPSQVAKITPIDLR